DGRKLPFYIHHEYYIAEKIYPPVTGPLPLNSFSIKFFSPDDIRIKAEGRLLEDIFFRQYNIHDEYKMAVCAHHRGFPVSVRVMTMRQLAEEFLGE
ncbi:MAG: 4-phosphopantetheinyl transferase superfamily protein, partial [Acidobacteriota bacterium]|nr:4-phosphopantetheinyl transferase superfamily protein [Acidobacteriota bacterium]